MPSSGRFLHQTKFLEWMCLWWVEGDHCHVHVRLILPWCSMIGYKWSYIFHVHRNVGKHGFAQSYLLHAFPWPLLVCDGISTWLQDLVEPLKSDLTCVLFICGSCDSCQLYWFTLENPGTKPEYFCEVLTFDIIFATTTACIPCNVTGCTSIFACRNHQI
jgi:hypothetical protein